jgi:hypothetical protein
MAFCVRVSILLILYILLRSICSNAVVVLEVQIGYLWLE